MQNRRTVKINDVAHFSLLIYGNEHVHTANTYTTAVLRSTVVFWVILRSTPLQCTKYTPGKGGYVVFWETYEVLRPAPLPPKTGHPQACPTRVVVRTKSPTVEDRSGGSTQTGARAARKNSRATTAVLALPVLLPVRVRGSFRTDTY